MMTDTLGMVSGFLCRNDYSMTRTSASSTTTNASSQPALESPTLNFECRWWPGGLEVFLAGNRVEDFEKGRMNHLPRKYHALFSGFTRMSIVDAQLLMVKPKRA
jgi:hypothetical protein